MSRIDVRRVKIHRSYTIDEAARLLSVHKNTVRAWIRSGLQTADDRRPTLILGRHLKAFLNNRRRRKKQTCGPDQMYCLRCRSPKDPAGQLAEYIAITAISGNLRGYCPDCDGVMHRRVSREKLLAVTENLKVTVAQAQETLKDSNAPSQNRNSNREAKAYADA